MVHPATIRTAMTAIAALEVPVDIGFVFPPKEGEERGYGQWTNRDLSSLDVAAMLPRAAAANARGGNIYIRLGPSVREAHPGIVMLDDLLPEAVDRLANDGLEPCLVVETSHGSMQAWIRLAASCTVPYQIVGGAVRHLAEAYGGDRRAVSPRQPGRLPGFTNRKPKHQQSNGQFPFVCLVVVEPGRVARTGSKLLYQLSAMDTAGAAAGASPETPRFAAAPLTNCDARVWARLSDLYAEESSRIAGEVASGHRPANAGSASEIDFALAVAALRDGIAEEPISAWLAVQRPDKHSGYAERTVEVARLRRKTRSDEGGPHL